MKYQKFPDANVEKYIADFARECNFEVFEYRYASCEQMPEYLRKRKNDEWVWSLRRPGSLVWMDISVDYPSYFTSIVLQTSSSSLKRPAPAYFLFHLYLEKVVQAKWEISRRQKVIEERSWPQNWNFELEFFKEHLKGHLNKVVEGRDWPEIYFSWDDYVSPEEAGKIYEDQVTVIEKGMKKKGQSWLYLLNPFKK
ncbi:MAG: hypothetical protein OM95_16880 [Bdellovibrio sp. ArHS]|uniref:hypothetical protein n=1 Tax=Bdellovibrio sp. ArHS TaxID=1569284 RepID=UPI00058324F7|nr:hypothetical protein [Bdellovibrio sp. ArHS]KHD86994.1 MAG: hypothetical protein OM95_16880 [Bdellovibrio sp. ArHS]